MENFPVLLLIPLFLGMIAHWAMAYYRGKLEVSLFEYMFSNFTQTISATIASLTALVAAYATAPEAFLPASLPQQILLWLSIFLGGYTGDSAFNGVGPFKKTN